MLYHAGGNWSDGAGAGKLGSLDNTPSPIGARRAIIGSMRPKKMTSDEVWTMIAFVFGFFATQGGIWLAVFVHPIWFSLTITGYLLMGTDFTKKEAP